MGIRFAPGGLFGVCRDELTTGSPAAFGTHPPIATTPASFTDGTLALGGTLTDVECFYQLSSQVLYFSAKVAWTDGDLLQNIPASVSAEGLSGPKCRSPRPTRGRGSLARIGFDPRAFECSPVPARASTWGRLKAISR